MFPDKINPSWQSLIDDNKKQLLEIERQIKNQDINPDLDKVLRFLELDLAQIKVVILGQDPYPEPGVATGRSFQVKGLNDWTKPFRQTSFRNILRLIYKNCHQIDNYAKIPTFTQIKDQIISGQFVIKNPYDLITDWEKQGVLMLNASFSCVRKQPLSHQDLWSDFSDKLIKYIDQQNPQIKWFLWGKSAQKLAPLIENGQIYASRHPMMCSSKYEDDFLKSNCFKDSMSQIDWRGKN